MDLPNRRALRERGDGGGVLAMGSFVGLSEVEGQMVEKVKRVSRSISFPEKLSNELEKEAEARMISPSVLVEKAVERFLPTLPKIDLGAQDALEEPRR